MVSSTYIFCFIFLSSVGGFFCFFLICFGIYNKILACKLIFLFNLMIVCGVNRYVATDIPSDLLVQVGDVNFHVHKVVSYYFGNKVPSLNCILYCMIEF